MQRTKKQEAVTMIEENNTKVEPSSIPPTAGQPGGLNKSFDPTLLSASLVIHPNVTKMWHAFQSVVEESAFYESDTKVKKFLEVTKLPDSSQKYWRSSMTNARKELNDKAIEEAKDSNQVVIFPSDEAIEDLAIEKFKDTWKKFGKGKVMPVLPLKN
jgi:hypothetical protein